MFTNPKIIVISLYTKPGNENKIRTLNYANKGKL